MWRGRFVIQSDVGVRPRRRTGATRPCPPELRTASSTDPLFSRLPDASPLSAPWAPTTRPDEAVRRRQARSPSKRAATRALGGTRPPISTRGISQPWETDRCSALPENAADREAHTSLFHVKQHRPRASPRGRRRSEISDEATAQRAPRESSATWTHERHTPKTREPENSRTAGQPDSRTATMLALRPRGPLGGRDNPPRYGVRTTRPSSEARPVCHTRTPPPPAIAEAVLLFRTGPVSIGLPHARSCQRSLLTKSDLPRARHGSAAPAPGRGARRRQPISPAPQPRLPRSRRPAPAHVARCQAASATPEPTTSTPGHPRSLRRRPANPGHGHATKSTPPDSAARIDPVQLHAGRKR